MLPHSLQILLLISRGTLILARCAIFLAFNICSRAVFGCNSTSRKAFSQSISILAFASRCIFSFAYLLFDKGTHPALI